MHEAQWEGESGRSTGNASYVTFDLPGRMWVCGIRLVAWVKTEQNAHPYFKIQWKERGSETFSKENSYVNFQLPLGGYGQFTFYTDSWIDQIRILPDNKPCEFHIHEIVLLLAPEGSPAGLKRPKQAEGAGRGGQAGRGGHGKLQ